MLNRKLLAVSLAVAALAGFSSVAEARTDVGIVLNFAPPAPRYEVLPAPRVGYVWAPGYWGVRANRHYWYAGHWERNRPGYAYYPSRWTYVGNHWRHDHGYWGRGSYRHR